MNTVYESRVEEIEHTAAVAKLKVKSERIYNRLDIEHERDKGFAIAVITLLVGFILGAIFNSYL